MSEELKKRDVPALIEALRIRALALTGAEWERTATRDMMKEAAQNLEDLWAALGRRGAQEERLRALFDRVHAWNESDELDAIPIMADVELQLEVALRGVGTPQEKENGPRAQNEDPLLETPINSERPLENTNDFPGAQAGTLRQEEKA